MKTILWFRRDLRVEDVQLLSVEGEVLPIFIFDKNILDSLDKDDKRVDFIFKTVFKLKEQLKALGLDLLVFYSKPVEVFEYLTTLGFFKVYASVDYDSYAIKRDKEVEELVSFTRFNDNYIFDVDEILKDDMGVYKVFTPFYNKAKTIYQKEHALEYKRANNSLYDFNYEDLIVVDDKEVKKLPFNINSIGFISNDRVYQDAKSVLESFKSKVQEYKQNRDFLTLDGTSNLSLYLRFGTISIREVLRTLVSLRKEGIETESFFRQLVFRDYYAYLLFHFSYVENEDFKTQAPFYFDEKKFNSFINAKTGVPLVDAAITQLLTTGFMHNRARMVAASFFCKQLFLPWQKGEEFFAKHLMDYDKASNVLSWQWCSSTGVDAQPYYRVFNPYEQAKKFDKEALYIKKYLPFLEKYSAKQIHKEEFLFETSIEGYVKPIVKNAIAREEFLKTFKK